MSALKKQYKETLRKALQDKLGLTNIMAVPKVSKITINMGVGAAAADKKLLQKALAELTSIAGQKPVATLAKKSVAAFKIREGWPIGCKVTLRGDIMYEFLDRLIAIVIPRIRDFRGFSARSFDGRGNYSLGVKEQIVFPEIEFDQVDIMRGLDICITTTATDNRSGFELLKAFGFPFKEKEIA